MLRKTSELSGAALDWAVAKCEGYTSWCRDTEKLLPPRKEYGWVDLCDLRYSTDWTQGGPIIEREHIELTWWGPQSDPSRRWKANRATEKQLYYRDFYESDEGGYRSPTALIAAMRCFVASRLGDEVDIPEELTCSNS